MTDETNTDPAQRVAHAAALTFDLRQYRRLVEDAGLSEAQECEFLEALWTIVVGFVDLKFNLHPIQQVTDVPQTLELESPSMVSCEDNSDSNKTLDVERLNGRVAQRIDS